MGAHAITSDFESNQIGWEIQGVDCDVVLTNGYALKACAEEQEVRSTADSGVGPWKFKKANVLRAFSAKEGDSNAFLIQDAGGIYRQVMEM